MRELEISMQAVRDHFTPESSLKDLFTSIEKDLQEEGFVVCQYVLNGMNLSEDDESRLSVSRVSEVRDLKVKYESPRFLLTSIVASWLEEIPGLIQQADELAEAARTLSLDSKMPRFIRFVENAQLLVESLISMSAIVQLEQFGVGQEWEKTEKAFNVSISEALSSFQGKDLNLLADVLEYDIADGLQKWFDLLKQIDGSLKNESASAGDSGNFALFRQHGDSAAEARSAGDQPSAAGDGDSTQGD